MKPSFTRNQTADPRRLSRQGLWLPLQLFAACWALAVIFLTISGCFCRPANQPNPPVLPNESRQQPPPPTGPAQKPALPNAPAAKPPQIIADITVVALDQSPLAGMIPIVTEHPNAFDPPPYRGEPTSHQGQSRIVFPADRTWYLRAWDPELKWFANNFLEVSPSDEDAGMEGTIVMAQASALGCMFTDANGAALAERKVDLMLVHPQQGPWWPARQVSTSEGTVLFSPLPPGRYDLEFSIDGAVKRLPDILLVPGEALNLGSLNF